MALASASVRVASGVHRDAPVDAVIVVPISGGVVKAKLEGAPLTCRQSCVPRSLRALLHRDVPYVAPLAGTFAAMEKHLVRT